VAETSLARTPAGTRRRSWLYAPGHSEKLLQRVFQVGADSVVLDLEDGVPDGEKDRARALVAEAVASRRAWVRVNAPRSEVTAADIEAVASHAEGIRIPKVESAADAEWVAERAGGVPLAATIESAKGVLQASAIAAVAGVAHLVVGTADLAHDLGVRIDSETIEWSQCQIVLGSIAAGKEAPVDGAYLGPDDEMALRSEAVRARRLGFSGKTAVRPWHVPVINSVFAPTPEEIEWAERVLARYEESGGAASRLASGELVDRPVADRARRILEEAL